jgi:dTDP-4-amino-4,6-dideoxygalactose transaminase
MQEKIIPVMKPRLPTVQSYTQYLKQIDQNGVYSNRGPLVSLLESRYSEKLGIKDSSLVVLCSNATIAIQGFLQISSAATWHIPSFTFAATVHAGIQSGKEVVLEDIDPRTWMISSSVVKSPKTEGLIPVLPFGAPLDSSEYSKLEHVLIDAAASIGGASAWINSIGENWGVVFSLHATKSFGIGEGGLLVFGSRELADKFRKWINFGFSGSRESLISATNAKLSEVQAAVGLAVLDNWALEEDDWVRARAMTDKVSGDLQIGPFDVIPIGTISPYWIISHADHKAVTRIGLALEEAGIETRKWWSFGCQEMPAFKQLNDKDFGNTKSVAGSYLGLPLFRGITQEEVGLVRSIVSDCV